MIKRREKAEKEVRSVRVLSKHFEQIADGDNKEGCGQCSKSTVPSKDGSHVKNRKLFFEEQAHVPENTKNIKNKTGK